MHNYYSTNDRKSQLHLVMLSPSTGGSNLHKAGSRGKFDSRLHFFVNRPMSAVMHNPRPFANMSRSIMEIMPKSFAVMSIEAFCATGSDDSVVPTEDDGIVLRFKLMPGIENPTEVVAKLAKELAEFFGVSLWDTKLSGHYGQEEPDSYEVLNLKDFQAQYLDANAAMALPQKVLVAG
jgi:hypothetical protein